MGAQASGASVAPLDPLDVGPGLTNDTPAVTEMQVPAGELVAIDAAGAIAVSFLVQSEPPDAQVSLDGRTVGRTPLRLKLDPRVDHLLTVERKGCESVVQLIATEAWRSGRSPQALVRLACP
jgi:hypothetical protein